MASMPFMPGRPISMMTRSGCVCLQNCKASAPLSRDPGFRTAFQNRTKPSRISLVIVHEHDIAWHEAHDGDSFSRRKAILLAVGDYIATAGRLEVRV